MTPNVALTGAGLALLCVVVLLTLEWRARLRREPTHASLFTLVWLTLSVPAYLSALYLLLRPG
jgi:hypothetical protein